MTTKIDLQKALQSRFDKTVNYAVSVISREIYKWMKKVINDDIALSISSISADLKIPENNLIYEGKGIFDLSFLPKFGRGKLSDEEFELVTAIESKLCKKYLELDVYFIAPATSSKAVVLEVIYKFKPQITADKFLESYELNFSKMKDYFIMEIVKGIKAETGRTNPKKLFYVCKVEPFSPFGAFVLHVDEAERIYENIKADIRTLTGFDIFQGFSAGSINVDEDASTLFPRVEYYFIARMIE